MSSRLFAPLKQPFYIECPPYRHTSGGVRVLNLLCHALNLQGEEAYLISTAAAPNLRAPLLTTEILRQHQRQGRQPLVLYPEIVDNNPYAAPQVLRYLLNVPGFLTGHYSFGDDELLVSHSRDILPEGWDGLLLPVPTSDRSLFNNNDNPYDNQRQGACFYAKKYFESGLPLLPITDGATELSPRVPQRSLEELAELLRRTKVLYAYEHSTLCFEALLCGCPVVYLPNDYMPQLYDNFVGRNGVAWGNTPEELAYAHTTLARVPEAFDRIENEFWNYLQEFIEQSHKTFASRASTTQAWSSFYDTLHKAITSQHKPWWKRAFKHTRLKLLAALGYQRSSDKTKK